MPEISMIRTQRSQKSGGIASHVGATSEETLRNRGPRYRDLERKATDGNRSS